VLALDRMAGIVDGRLTEPRQFLAADTFGVVVESLVEEVFPAATIEWDDGDSEQLGRALIAEADRYAFLDDLIRSLGKVWYWDHRGILVIRTAPTATDPVVDITAGEGGVLVALDRQLTREGVYNIVVATGEGTDTEVPIRAVAFDNNPASATYWQGRFGPVPAFYSSPAITTIPQAQSAAEAELLRLVGLPYTVNFAAVPNPALEPWDPVRIRSADRDAAEVHILRRVSIPLVAEVPMSATTREQGSVLVGMS
jgi:hypothetical protein